MTAITYDMKREADVARDRLVDDLSRCNAMPDGETADAIHHRLDHERMHANYYGFFPANGAHIAGGVLAFAPVPAAYREGTTLDHALKTGGDQVAPVVRATAEVRERRHAPARARLRRSTARAPSTRCRSESAAASCRAASA
ncbi:hypothetical protein WT60_17135 [Burkholderia sp. MSMB617WGS]|nr:hypothetical protein WT60_17135 [Burkholderia sp. MSMB617WGS]